MLNKNLDKILLALNKKIEKLPYTNTPIVISFEDNELVLSKPFELARKFKLDLLLPFFISLFLNGILLIRFINADYIKYNEKSTNIKNKNDKSEGPLEY